MDEKDTQPQIQALQQQLTLLQEEFDSLRKSDRYVYQKDLDIQNGRNMQLATDTGTKIGTATDQKLGFYGEVPKVQATVANTGNSAFSEEAGGTNINEDSTFGGWRIKEVVQALINIGILDGVAD